MVAILFIDIFRLGSILLAAIVFPLLSVPLYTAIVLVMFVIYYAHCPLMLCTLVVKSIKRLQYNVLSETEIDVCVILWTIIHYVG